MPRPATHLQPVQTAVKMVNASELSLRGPEGLLCTAADFFIVKRGENSYIIITFGI